MILEELKNYKNEVLDRLHVYLGYYREIEPSSEAILDIANTLREQAEVLEEIYNTACEEENDEI